jgi:hypothetical protein
MASVASLDRPSKFDALGGGAANRPGALFGRTPNLARGATYDNKPADPGKVSRNGRVGLRTGRYFEAAARVSV